MLTETCRSFASLSREGRKAVSYTHLVPKALLDKVMGELLRGRKVSITTYREGDKADTGYRDEIKELGFAEAELLVEYGYPTQRFVMGQEERLHE